MVVGVAMLVLMLVQPFRENVGDGVVSPCHCNVSAMMSMKHCDLFAHANRRYCCLESVCCCKPCIWSQVHLVYFTWLLQELSFKLSTTMKLVALPRLVHPHCFHTQTECVVIGFEPVLWPSILNWCILQGE